MARRIVGALAGAMLLVGGSACGNSSASKPTPPVKATTSTTSAAKPPQLSVVITNDDGIEAPGIDELAKQVRAIPNVEVHVVAPATNQSGTGDRATPGGAKHHDAATASGIEGTAVDGTPADSVNVALDDLGLKPDLVVSGINRGQNVGPLAAISGTVGAALTAVRRKVPAVAGSAGLTATADYAGAAKLVGGMDHRKPGNIAAHRMPKTAVVSFNVPDCSKGAKHGTVMAPLATAIPKGTNPFSTDCSVAPKTDKPADDVDALLNGYAVQSNVPSS